MIGSIRGKLSFANVMSMIAVMIALGGTSYAAGLARNSVGSTQIKTGAVKNSDLGSSAVTSGKVKNGSLQAADFAARPAPGRPEGRHRRDRRHGPDRRDRRDRATGRRESRARPACLGSVDRAPHDLAAARTSASVGVPGAADQRLRDVRARGRHDHRRKRQHLTTSRPAISSTNRRSAASTAFRQRRLAASLFRAMRGGFAFWKGTARTLTNVWDGVLCACSAY